MIASLPLPSSRASVTCEGWRPRGGEGLRREGICSELVSVLGGPCADHMRLWAGTGCLWLSLMTGSRATAARRDQGATHLTPDLNVGSHSSPPPVEWWVEAASTNVFEDDVLPSRGSAARRVELQMMAGEVEHRQIVVRLGRQQKANPLRNVTVQFAVTDAPASATFTWRQQGFVKCAQFFYETIRPVASNGSWFPDPIWSPDDGPATLWPGVTSSFWVDIAVGPGTQAGVFNGTIALLAEEGNALALIPLEVEVWDIALPALSNGRFTSVMSWIDASDFTSAHSITSLLSPGGGRHNYWQWMCDYRMPPNKLYVAPAFDFYSTGHGASDLESLTNATMNGSISNSCGGRGGASWISLGNVELLAGHRLPNYTAAQIDKALAAIAPTMQEAERLGVVDRVFACANRIKLTAASQRHFSLRILWQGMT